MRTTGSQCAAIQEKLLPLLSFLPLSLKTCPSTALASCERLECSRAVRAAEEAVAEARGEVRAAARCSPWVPAEAMGVAVDVENATDSEAATPRTPMPPPPTRLVPTRVACTAMALPMTGQRWASSCSFERAPPQGDDDAAAATRADGAAEAGSRAAAEDEREAVDSARSVAGEAFLRKGHTALDWRRTASMVGGKIVCEGRCFSFERGKTNCLCNNRFSDAAERTNKGKCRWGCKKKKLAIPLSRFVGKGKEKAKKPKKVTKWKVRWWW